MHTITFTCETITPMFLSGADQSVPELRPPSIKGALRFWWRAMNGHLVEKKKDKNNNDYWDYSKLKEQETVIFGGTESAQRSKVIIRTSQGTLSNSFNKLPSIDKKYNIGGGNILNYLAFGTQETSDKSFLRAYFQISKQFQITLRFPENITSDIIKSFYLFSEYGGLGSKSRNGFGSFQLKDCNLNCVDLKLFNNDMADYTALSKEIKLYKTKNDFTDAYTALGEIGMAYRDAKNTLNTNEKQYIALPMKGSGIKIERHTKPYFISVHKNNDDKYYGQILFIPYNYASGYTLKNGQKLSKNDIQSYQRNYFDATNKINIELANILTTLI